MEEKSREEIHKKICVHLTVIICGLLILIFVMPKLIKFFSPLIIAWIIAMIANPLVHFLEKRIKIMRKHGSALVILLVIAGIIALIYAVFGTLSSQISSIIDTLPDVYRSVTDNLQAFSKSFHLKYSFIPDNINKIFSIDNSKINDYILALLNSIKSPVSTVSSVASSVIDIFILSILTLMLAYFFIADNEKIKTTVKKCIPKSISSSIQLIKNTVFIAIGGYFKACFQIMILMFLILFLFFSIMKVDYAATIAIVTAVLDFFPFVGTGFILMPWALYSVITGEYLKAAALMLSYFITMLIHRLLEPKLVGDSIGMSPFLTLVSMFIGYRIMGMIGLIIGIPIGMILKKFYEAGFFNNTIKGIKILAEDVNEYRKYW